MTKRKRDDEGDTKDADDQQTLKRLKLEQPESSAREKVLNSPDLLPDLIGSFLDPEDRSNFGSANRALNSSVLKSESAARYKKTHTTCSECKNVEDKALPLTEKSDFLTPENFDCYKEGRYCNDCRPTECDNCDNVLRAEDMYNKDDEGLYCPECYSGEEEEEEEEDTECIHCSQNYGWTDSKGRCEHCSTSDTEDEEESSDESEEKEDEDKGKEKRECDQCHQQFQVKEMVAGGVCGACFGSLLAKALANK